jgi:hypothetical protein
MPLLEETTDGDHDLSGFGLIRAYARIYSESRYREEPEEGSLELHGKNRWGQAGRFGAKRNGTL